MSADNNQNKYLRSFWLFLLITVILPYYIVAKKLFKPSSFAYQFYVALNLLWLLILFLITRKYLFDVLNLILS